MDGEGRRTGTQHQPISQNEADFSNGEAAPSTLAARTESLLRNAFSRLSAHVAADLPFGSESRDARLERLGRILDDPELGVAEKARALVDAAGFEVKAGYAAETGTADIQAGGETIRVRQLHVGRIGLYALSPDGRSAWMWKPEAGAWVGVLEHARAVADAVRIAEGRRLAELVKLPVAPPELGGAFEAWEAAGGASPGPGGTVAATAAGDSGGADGTDETGWSHKTEAFEPTEAADGAETPGEFKEMDETEGAAKGGGIFALEALVRETAGDWLPLFRQSPFSAEAAGRLAALAQIQEKKDIQIGDLAALLELGFADIVEGGRIVRRNGEIVGRDGAPISAEILRLGHIAALYRGENGIGYLLPGVNGERLLASGQAGFQVRRNLNLAMESNPAKGEVPVVLDVTGGSAVRQLARDSDLWERVREGGFLVWPILLVGAVAFLLTIERIIFLGRVRQNTDRLMTRVAAMVDDGNFDGAVAATDSQAGRPTANVLRAGLGQRNQPRDIVESRLNEAILREMPRLERFLPALKVLAAIAPLLGLLGTVTGMINTFQVITVHGTGDPRLMAGGIGEALVTTQLGLAVAIPILVVSALLGRRAQTIASDMEEKAMALMAALLRNHLENGLENGVQNGVSKGFPNRRENRMANAREASP
jgi:biopolymer transport protein ExbB